jgi:hypothetical protein
VILELLRSKKRNERLGVATVVLEPTKEEVGKSCDSESNTEESSPVVVPGGFVSSAFPAPEIEPSSVSPGIGLPVVDTVTAYNTPHFQQFSLKEFILGALNRMIFTRNKFECDGLMEYKNSFLFDLKDTSSQSTSTAMEVVPSSSSSTNEPLIGVEDPPESPLSTVSIQGCSKWLEILRSGDQIAQLNELLKCASFLHLVEKVISTIGKEESRFVSDLEAILKLLDCFSILYFMIS